MAQASKSRLLLLHSAYSLFMAFSSRRSQHSSLKEKDYRPSTFKAELNLFLSFAWCIGNNTHHSVGAGKFPCIINRPTNRENGRVSLFGPWNRLVPARWWRHIYPKGPSGFPKHRNLEVRKLKQLHFWPSMPLPNHSLHLKDYSFEESGVYYVAVR